MGLGKYCTKGEFVAPGMKTKYQPTNWKIIVGLNTFGEIWMLSEGVLTSRPLKEQTGLKNYIAPLNMRNLPASLAGI